MPKVSIIVPFYNVEKYIEKCLQTLEDEGINIRFRKQLSTDKVGAIVRNLLY